MAGAEDPVADDSATGTLTLTESDIRRLQRLRTMSKDLDRTLFALTTARATAALRPVSVHQALALQCIQHTAYRIGRRAHRGGNLAQTGNLVRGEKLENPPQDHRSAQSSASVPRPPRMAQSRKPAMVSARINDRPTIQAKELCGCAL